MREETNSSSSSQEEEHEIKDLHYNPSNTSPPVEEDEEEISILDLGLLRLGKTTNLINLTTTPPKMRKRRFPVGPTSPDHPKQEGEQEEEEEEGALSVKKPKKQDGFLRSHLPPLPPSRRPLRRTISDPSPVPTTNCQVEGTPVPNTPSTRLRRTLSDPSSASHYQDYHHPNPLSQMVASGDSQESVSVEKNGDNLTLHFQCPCSRAFQVLISGGSCYYKLI